MLLVCAVTVLGGKKWGLKTVKNGPRVWAFCKIEFPGIQKPVQILAQKMGFFKKCGNRGVGVIWLVLGVELIILGLCSSNVALLFGGEGLFGVVSLVVFCFWLAVVFSGCKMKHILIIYLL